MNYLPEIVIMHPWIFGYLAIINIIAFFGYGADKLLAIANSRRVRERTLLALALVGGSVGALLGMYLFHHKTSKARFQLLFAVIVLLHIGLLFFILNSF